MDFIERDLEDIVFNTDVNLLSERGLPLLFNAHSYRQLQIGNYGVADIVQFKLEKDPYLDGNEYKFRDIVSLKIIELKKDEINVFTFLQTLKYAKGLENYYNDRQKKRRFGNRCQLKISIALVGKKINTKDDFIYLPNFLYHDDFELDLYTYKYDFDGISFKHEYGYDLVNNGLKERLSFGKYIKTKEECNHEQDN